MNREEGASAICNNNQIVLTLKMGTINAQHIAATSAMPQNYASKFQNGILRLNWKLISVKRQILKTFKMNTIVGDVQMILA